MKRRLIVLRHAKSAWNTATASDHERPLNKRGIRDAPRMAEKLVELDWQPQRVLSSDSQRTRETWAGMKPVLTTKPSVVFTRDLYHAGLGSLRELVADVDPTLRDLMVIGHNPGWEDMVSCLTGDYITMTTCNAALLTVKADDWVEALQLESCWKLRHLLRPKEI